MKKSTSLRSILTGFALLFAGCLYTTGAQAQATQPFQGKVGKTLGESTESWQPEKKLPKGTPNVIWILLDDVGFGASSAFGGLIHTPTFDSLANNGLRYVNFHTTGVCAPTRAALLTGRNHHSVHMGLFPHEFMSAGFPGYDARIPSEKGTIAEILRESGYNTYQLGKWHLTPDAEMTDAGPFDRWPSGKGFDHNYGFLSGATDQYKPALVEDNYNIKPDGRHLNELLADKAISYISHQIAVAPDKPFFMYFAPGATHSPHQVDTKWSDKYKGKFDAGWDAYREAVFANQKKLGIIPADAKLPERNQRVKAWKDLSPDEKKVYARFMEVYAGFLDYTDYEIGRIVSYLKTAGQLDNTAIFVVIGDNGASKEGTANGTVQTEFTPLKGDEPDHIAYLLKNYDKIGTPDIQSTNYPTGWAQAANTPFRYWKADANAEGGTRNPLIVFYPDGIKEKGGIRNQYGHVIDLIPTTLDLVGIKAPEKIRGITQDSLQGTSLAYLFADAKAVSRHRTQYYYLFGSGAIYNDGWKAEFPVHPDFWDLFGSFKPYQPTPDDNKQIWELYNTNTDFNERINLAKKNPEKLKELEALFDSEAKKNNVYPLINWSDVQVKYQEYVKKIIALKSKKKE